MARRDYDEIQVGDSESFSKTITLDSIKNNLLQYIYGSITLAIVAGIVFGILTFIFLKLTGKKQPVVTGAD